jgi:hypothetical protein
MKTISSLLWTLFWAALACVVAWALGSWHVLGLGIAPGHLLDWIMGFLCFLWLIVILKAPWDLYFQAHQVAFELQRSRESGIEVLPDRETYVRTVRRRLLWLAVGAHLLSALLVAAVTYYAGGVVGYYFALFYLVSTAFRPAVAGYAYLSEKLRTIGQEARYPRQDVVELRRKLEWLENAVRTTGRHTDMEIYELVGSLPARAEQIGRQLTEEVQTRTREVAQLRQMLQNLSREFEAARSRLTENQEVIKGIQAFARLVSQSARP